MSDKILSKYKFAARVMIIFSVEILFIAIIGSLFGDDAMEISNLYQLGGKGIANITVLQLFLCSIAVNLVQSFSMNSKLFENVMMLWRTVIMVVLIVLVILIFVICFRWFPLDFWPAWIGFFTSFGICFIISTILMVIKTKLEEKKYDRLLKNYKERKKMHSREGE
ncbi:hypothetical protein [uncultured Robinsoniella sp.]|uniref:hypothetical protein n=1 Tax=uncultured Robinsoniella sp. TaxID=904190 RepID=UPI00374F3021